MGRFFKRLLLFVVATGSIYLVGMFAMIKVSVLGGRLIYRSGDYYNMPGGDSWQRFHEFDPATRWDAVILGSSHAYRGYDPAVFAEHGHHVFNLGSSGQTPLNSYFLIKNYLDSTNCALLIFDVYERAMQKSDLESTADLTQNMTSNTAALEMAWAIHDLRGLNMMALRMLYRPTKPDYTAPGYMGLGYTVKYDSIGKDAGPPSTRSMKLSERHRHYLEASLQLCRERGIPVVMTSHYGRSDLRVRPHEGLTRYIDSVLTGTGIPYLDFTNTPGIQDRNWFFDSNHLNGTGAKIFTRQLVDSLESLGLLSQKQVVVPPEVRDSTE